MADYLSSMLNSAVQIFDNKFNTILCSNCKGNTQLLDSSCKSIEKFFLSSTGKPNLIIIEKVVVNDDTYGYIVVTKLNNEPFTDLENITISTAKTVVALIMLNEKSLIEKEEGLKGDLLDDIIDGNCSEEVILRRFRYIGYPKSDYIVYIVSMDVPTPFHQTGEFENSKINENILSIIKEYFRLNQHTYILKNKGKKIIILLHVKNDLEKDKIKKSFLSILDCVKVDTSSSIYIGFGRKCINVSEIKTSFLEADKALKIGKYIWGNNFIVGYEELGIYRLFIENANQEELKKHCDETVGQIIAYDQSRNANLFETLETFYKCDKNISKTSKHLFIHRHTLRYRLERIKLLTGLDPNKSKDSLTLQIGILISYLLFDPKN